MKCDCFNNIPMCDIWQSWYVRIFEDRSEYWNKEEHYEYKGSIKYIDYRVDINIYYDKRWYLGNRIIYNEDHRGVKDRSVIYNLSGF